MKTVACSSAHRERRRAAFTLIELMIVVAIIGILAALGIPVFRTVLLRSKTAEASTNLNSLFKSAASYYATERAGGPGQDAALVSGCTIGEITPGTPHAQKQRLPSEAGFRAIGFNVTDYTYYVYGVANETASATGACGGQPNDATVYTLYAHGDLDDDTELSTFELAVGSDNNNQLYHARGLYIDAELE